MTEVTTPPALTRATPEMAEGRRLDEARQRLRHWKRWGPYLSERAWGSVREDYSPYGTAWDYFPHDHARSRAYRWGEDGLGGICDRHQRICFAIALWNGRDPILKERLFGLTGSEGNPGEDVKEYYFYIDSTPTHSYMKFLYKYPQAAFPYAELVNENSRRGRHALEFELIDTGVFNDTRYFDVEVEYAKADAEDILIRIHVTSRGPERAAIHVLPTVWFRNTWSWCEGAERPRLGREHSATHAIVLDEPRYGRRWLHMADDPTLLFTENDTDTASLFGYENGARYTKDGVPSIRCQRRAGRSQSRRVRNESGYALFRGSVPWRVGHASTEAERRRAGNRAFLAWRAIRCDLSRASARGR